MSFKPEAGQSIYNTTKDAIVYCAENNCTQVQFSFNEIMLTVSYNSNATDICEIYSLKHSLRQKNGN